MSGDSVPAVCRSHQSRYRAGLLALIFLAIAEPIAWAQDEANTVFPNTLQLQPLNLVSAPRDIIRLRSYDFVGSPACSRDGEWIAFDAYKIVSPRVVSLSECLIVRSDGTGLKKLADGAAPRWSPDGKRLLFMREGQGNPDVDLGIYVIDRDGTETRRIGPGRWPVGVHGQDRAAGSAFPGQVRGVYCGLGAGRSEVRRERDGRLHLHSRAVAVRNR